MRTTSGADIIVDGDVVIKVHRLGTDPEALRVRLRIATQLGGDADGCLLAPLDTEPQPVDGGAGRRWCTRWPRVETVPVRPEGLPWSDAARLLAQLHRTAHEAVIPHGAAARTVRSVAALPAGAASVIGRAAARLPDPARRPWSPGRPNTLVHGDFHLGQLGRRPAARWRLIDVDDLGVGDPAWDLARPAGFWAAGLLPDDDWHAFVAAYRTAGGPAVPAGGDPWPVLEPVARAAVVQAAASGARRDPDETQEQLVAACARMAHD
ncbi:phosphotransferase family protein [Mycobacterium sp. EPa45]|uniref:phosphotransferase family protein n=1 Tax=Mycobacterium sp. EPa45 TaxID=1545728 RepID=UPI0006422757|nr:aminoglycoside phosphotransferase family protein [Mycobacterium sp. EPa45]AKK25514.1 aminoglycoside phosphotransferase [Mycobacterium sp. EPa45]